jgi:hypothetical protein
MIWISDNPFQDINLMKIKYLVLAISLSAFEANADNSTLDAAIGGGLGGAAGAAIGNEVGGRDGAILGGALGGAVGAAVTTDRYTHQYSPPPAHYRYAPPRRSYPYEYAPSWRGHPYGYHCPPGQRKKGRC